MRHNNKKVLTQRKNKRLRRIMIRLNQRDYDKILDLKSKTYSHSFSRVANILLDYQLKHPNPLNDKNLIDIKRELARTNEIIGNTLMNVRGGFSNLNQISEKINIAKVNNEKMFSKANITNSASAQNIRDAWQELAADINMTLKPRLEKYEKILLRDSKEIRNIWQYLE